MYDPVMVDPDWLIAIGSRFAADVVLLALVERLRRTFATREDVKALEDRFERLRDATATAARLRRTEPDDAVGMLIDQSRGA